MGVRKPPMCVCGGELLSKGKKRPPVYQCQACKKVFTAGQVTVLALLQET
jgi:tRNA(Ile2) C34 agmatinyltransferase TiaS